MPFGDIMSKYTGRPASEFTEPAKQAPSVDPAKSGDPAPAAPAAQPVKPDAVTAAVPVGTPDVSGIPADSAATAVKDGKAQTGNPGVDGKPASGAPSTDDERYDRIQRHFESELHKRLGRAGRAQERALSERDKKIAELEKKLNEATGMAEEKLTPEDFGSRAEYDAWREKKLSEKIRAEVTDEVTRNGENVRQAQEMRRAVEERITTFFPKEEDKRAFRERMRDMYEDNEEFFGGEGGNAFSEACEATKFAPVIYDLLAKNPEAMAQLVKESPDQIRADIRNIERIITDKLTQAKAAPGTPAAADPALKAPAKKPLPVTGPVGGGGGAGTGFNARAYLAKKYPGKY